MKINDYFIKNYLTPGVTKDNFIFTDCPTQFLRTARNYLSVDQVNTKPCCVTLFSADDEIMDRLLSQCDTTVQRKLVAQEYLLDLILMELYKNDPKHKKDYDDVCDLESILEQGDLSGIFGGHIFEDIQEYHEKDRPIEIDFILMGVKNKYLQSAINNYISSRTPYSVKVFADRDLCNYYDLGGNIIQSTHDYISMDVNDYISISDNADETIL